MQGRTDRCLDCGAELVIPGPPKAMLLREENDPPEAEVAASAPSGTPRGSAAVPGQGRGEGSRGASSGPGKTRRNGRGTAAASAAPAPLPRKSFSPPQETPDPEGAEVVPAVAAASPAAVPGPMAGPSVRQSHRGIVRKTREPASETGPSHGKRNVVAGGLILLVLATFLYTWMALRRPAAYDLEPVDESGGYTTSPGESSPAQTQF